MALSKRLLASRGVSMRTTQYVPERVFCWRGFNLFLLKHISELIPDT